MLDGFFRTGSYMMKGDILHWVNRLLVDMNIDAGRADGLDRAMVFAVILVLAGLLYLLCRYAIVGAIQRIVRRTKVTWDDVLLDQRVLRRFFNIFPVVLVYTLLPLAFDGEHWLQSLLLKVCSITIVLMIVLFINSLLGSIFALIERREELRARPMKGLYQLLQVIVFFVGAIVVLSVMTDQSLITLFAGLGASAAVLMLIFKDSILGFVSGVQLSANNMLRPGDWISVPKYGADGTVIDVTLNTVKVRNFDNTITTIPPYALTSESFQNWRGMEESPGRRVKRSINIDMNSVKFCTPEMIERYKRIALIREYVESKEQELRQFHIDTGSVDDPTSVNRVRQTNIGVFRRYLDFYLESLPGVNHSMTCMVRQLQPTESGIPIELYFFSKDKNWVNYERLQADVFDHILGIIPVFDLYVFQNPTGRDFRNLAD